MGNGGSSPRVWGTHPDRHPYRVERRFIPTRVGNTFGTISISLAIYGSSPRVWGTRNRRQRAKIYRRFIPTRVGNTFGTISISLAIYGSSPRVWGTQLLQGCFFVVLRFIPTRVGNTRRRPAGVRPGSVHPHACGEHVFPSDSKPFPFGSSPRVWGTLTPTPPEQRLRWFIPTRVGNT